MASTDQVDREEALEGAEQRPEGEDGDGEAEGVETVHVRPPDLGAVSEVDGRNTLQHEAHQTSKHEDQVRTDQADDALTSAQPSEEAEPVNGSSVRGRDQKHVPESTHDREHRSAVTCRHVVRSEDGHVLSFRGMGRVEPSIPF